MCTTVENESKIERELLQYGTVGFRITGNSMNPLFSNQRDAVFLKKAVPEQIKKYDIILYKSQGIYILHRVVSKKGALLIVRGDNTYTNEYLDIKDVLAVVDVYVRRDKSHSVNEVGYRFYSRFWTFVYPLRKFVRRVKIKLTRKRKKS